VHGGGGEDLVGRGVISGYSRGEGKGRHSWFGGMEELDGDIGICVLEGIVTLLRKEKEWKVG